MSRFDLIITDLDNTLYDWVGFYIPSFVAMVREIHRISGIAISDLKDAFRRVHQKHGTTEYAFAIEELDVLDKVDAELSPEERLQKYDSAVHAFRLMRRSILSTYPGVRRTLSRLKSGGVLLVAHSDAMMSYVSRRLRQLEIDSFFDALCATTDHGIPAYLSEAAARKAPMSEVSSRIATIELPMGIRKPDPQSLEIVLDRFGVPRGRTAYVGDSLSRDVLLARRCGVVDVWAQYGHTTNSEFYRELLDITYWTENEVMEEEKLRAEVGTLIPTFTIGSFPELLKICGLE